MAVVVDGQDRPALVGDEHELDRGRAGVAGDVRERFLGDAVDDQLLSCVSAGALSRWRQDVDVCLFAERRG